MLMHELSLLSSPNVCVCVCINSMIEDRFPFLCLAPDCPFPLAGQFFSYFSINAKLHTVSIYSSCSPVEGLFNRAGSRWN